MSGLELLGALASVAQLGDLSIKILKSLSQLVLELDDVSRQLNAAMDQGERTVRRPKGAPNNSNSQHFCSPSCYYIQPLYL
jgi:hypothetical protein